jgi:predicted nucleic acid-binding protein
VKTGCVVVDANIAFKTLCSNRGDLRRRLGPARTVTLYSPSFLFVELFKYKDRLEQTSGLGQDDLLHALHRLTGSLEFVNEATIPVGTWVEGYRLSRGVDEKDAIYVALTLHLDGELWTDDGELKTGLRSRGFTRFFQP